MFPGPSDFGPRCLLLLSDSLTNTNFILITLSGTKLDLGLDGFYLLLSRVLVCK